jgi:hypothetical protein
MEKHFPDVESVLECLYNCCRGIIPYRIFVIRGAPSVQAVTAGG